MKKRSVRVSEGDVFAIPIGNRWAIGLAARVSRDGFVLAYVFGPPRGAIPHVGELQGLTPQNVLLVERTTNMGLRRGEWPILGQLPHWNRDEWVVPKFGRYDKVSGIAWLVSYSDDVSHVVREERTNPANITGLPSEGFTGHLGLSEYLEHRMLPTLRTSTPPESTKPRKVISHFFYFHSREDGSRASTRLGRGFKCRLRRSATKGLWLLTAETAQSDVPESRLAEVALQFGGEYDGWESAS